MRRISETGLSDRILLTGALGTDALRERYARADIFAMPSRYEGYGMAFAGALASGLPVVAARAGAVPGTVPPDAGILVPPEDAPAVREALYALLTDRELRRRLSDAAWAHAQTLPRWTDTARTIAAVLREVAT
jgi:glycosyltransferase involved in cell wall biosynthesis